MNCTLDNHPARDVLKCEPPSSVPPVPVHKKPSQLILSEGTCCAWGCGALCVMPAIHVPFLSGVLNRALSPAQVQNP